MTSTYTQKLNAFAPTKTWSVSQEGLRWADQDEEMETGLIPWTRIKSTRLRFEPSRAERRRTALHIYAPNDYAITNINYRGILNFELQQNEFRTFLESFHKAMAQHSGAEMHKGSTMGAYIGNCLIILFTGLLLIAVAELVTLTGVPGLTSLVRLGIIALLIPTLFKYFKRNKPATYAPENWPREMLQD